MMVATASTIPRGTSSDSPMLIAAINTRVGVGNFAEDSPYTEMKVGIT